MRFEFNVVELSVLHNHKTLPSPLFLRTIHSDLVGRWYGEGRDQTPCKKGSLFERIS